jgi:genome maintenance exonuclease 1
MDPMAAIPQPKLFTHLSNKFIFEELEQINSDTGRTYKTPSGVIYPSITTVVGDESKASIAAWRKRVGDEEANRVSKKATSRGTRIHEMCEHYVDNIPLIKKDYVYQDLEMFNQIKRILDEHVDNIHMQEERLYSDYLELAGTVDLIAEYDDKLSVIDFKTSTKLKEIDYIKGYLMQASAYAIMYEERTGTPISQTVIIIGVDDEMYPQVFIQKRDVYVPQLLETRKLYKEKYEI